MNAPGCFGAASVFSHDSTHCQNCPAFGECSGVAVERLQSLSDKIDVSDLIKRHQKAQSTLSPHRVALAQKHEIEGVRIVQRLKPIGEIQRKTKVEKVVFEIDPETENAIARVGNKKANAIAITLCKAGPLADMRDKLNQGENPLPEKPGFIKVLGDKLATEKHFTKNSLKLAFKEAFPQWSDTTAASHVSIAVSLASGLGIVVEDGDRFVLLPASAGHNSGSQ